MDTSELPSSKHGAAENDQLECQPEFMIIRNAAREALKAENYVDALELHMECLKLKEVKNNPAEESKICLNIARCLIKVGANSLAMEFLRRAEKKYPVFYKPRMWKGYLLQDAEKYGGAIVAYKKTLSCLSKNATNIEQSKLQSWISQAENMLKKCEKRMENTQRAMEDPNDVDLRIVRLPVRDVIPDLKVLFDLDPRHDNSRDKPYSNEQPLLHRILYTICDHYTIPEEYATLNKDNDFLFDDKDRIKFLKKLPKLCKERQRVLSELCGLSTNNSWVEWTVRIFSGNELMKDNQIIVIYAENDIENFHIFKPNGNLGEHLNILLRLTIIWSLNHRAAIKTAPVAVTIVAGEALDMEVVTKGMEQQKRPEDELDIKFIIDLPDIG